MMGPPPVGEWNIGPLDGREEVKILRCSTCRKGFDSSITSVLECPYCGGKRWTNQIGRITLIETIRLYWLTKVLFVNPGSLLSKVLRA